jgi:hypothetical protein
MDWYGVGTEALLRLYPGSTGIFGRTEKNLCLHGSHRSAGNRSSRPKNAPIPGTNSGAMLFNSVLPQMAQCAFNRFCSGMARA